MGHFIEHFIKALEVVGTLNAVFLSVSHYWRKLMFPRYRPKQAAIIQTGFAVVTFPFFWISKERVVASGKEIWFEVPIAILGAATYIVLSILFFGREWVEAVIAGCGVECQAITIAWAISLIGVAFSARMMYLMFLRIKIVCPFCVFSALTMLAIFTYNTGAIIL